MKHSRHQVAPRLTHGQSHRLCRTGLHSMSLLGLLRAPRQLKAPLAESIPFTTPPCPQISTFHDRFLLESQNNIYLYSTPLATGYALQSHRNKMELPAASCGVSCEILRSHYPPSPRLRRCLLAFIPVAAYSAEVPPPATKAGSYRVFGEAK